MRIPDKVTSDDRKSSGYENIRQVALLDPGKSQKKPLAANKKYKIEPDNLFSWFQYFFKDKNNQTSPTIIIRSLGNDSIQGFVS